MSILPQQKYLLKPCTPHHASKTLTHITLNPFRVRCSITTPTKSNSSSIHLVVESNVTVSPSPTSTVFDPNPASDHAPTQIIVNSNPPRPDDPDLKSTWAHRAWVASGCTTLLVSLAKSIAISYESHSWAGPVISSIAGYILADLGSGVYHWGIDNYGNATTPVFGPQIEAFQGHHKWPWTITKRQFANNLHSLARAIIFTVLPLDLVVNDPTLLAFIGSFAGCIMFSQQFHAWAHSTKSKLPKVVVALQEAGVLVSRTQHGAHHRPPYNSNYCIVSGIWNEVLDDNRVFEVLEMVLFFQFGLRPRSWSEPSLEWTEESSLS